MICFNPSNVYALLYAAPSYGNSSIYTNLGNMLGVFVQILTFFKISYCTLVLSHVIYDCEVCNFYFHFGYFLSISYCLNLLLASHSEMKWVFNIMSHLNTRWMGVACNIT